MTWFQIWTVCWQVAVFLTPTIMGVCVLWMRSQFVTKADATTERNRVDQGFATVRQEIKAEGARIDGVLNTRKIESDQRWETLREKTGDHEGRLVAVEKELARPPTRHTLNNEVSKVQGALVAVERGIDDMRRQTEAQGTAIARQMEVLDGYLRTIIEKHIA